MGRSLFTCVVVVAVLAVSTTPCATPGAPVPKHLMPKEEPVFFPTKVGDRTVSVLGGQEIVCVITKAEKVADGVAVTQECEDENGVRTHDVTVIASSKGLKMVAYADRKPVEPIWLLKLPPEANNEWTEHSGAMCHGMSVTRRIIGWQQIEVPAGKFRAIGVQSQGTTSWYAPGLGCIKWARGDISRELKSFTPGK